MFVEHPNLETDWSSIHMESHILSKLEAEPLVGSV